MSSTEMALSHRQTPPGPRGHWLLGSMRDFQRDLLGFLQSLVRDYGDLVRYRFVIWHGYLANHPDYIKHILQDNHRNYSKDTFSFNLIRPVVGDGLLTSEGELWLRQRHLAQPAFHRQRLAAFGSLMTGAALAVVDRWRTLAGRGQPVSVDEEMMRLTLRVAGQALFGLDISGELDTVGRAFTTVSKFVGESSRDPFSRLFMGLPTPGYRRFRAAVQELEAVVQAIIDERRRQNTDTGDLLSMLLLARDEATGEGMNDRQLRDEVMTLLLAGHETTANALTWTWYLLSRHAEAERKLHAELRTALGGRLPTVQDLPNLPYSRMVIEEALRLYPPGTIITRKALSEDALGPFRLPPNAIVLMSPFLMHRHPAFWDEPEKFEPERFSPERSAARPAFAYFPFGGGPRLCIGNNFAMLEAQLTLATLAQHFRLRSVSGQPVEPEALITLRPRGGLPMTVHPVHD